MILDILRLVDNLAEKADVFIFCQISFQQLIRSNQNIPALGAMDNFCPLPGRPGHHFYRNAGGKSLKLAVPVKYQRCRGDNQAPSVILRFCLQKFRQQKGYRLQSLSKPHIVRKNAAKSVMAKSFQPHKTVFLVLAQGFLQTCRDLKIIVLHGFHVSYQLFKGSVSYCQQILLFFQLAVQIQSPVFRRCYDFLP